MQLIKVPATFTSTQPRGILLVSRALPAPYSQGSPLHTPWQDQKRAHAHSLSQAYIKHR